MYRLSGVVQEHAESIANKYIQNKNDTLVALTFYFVRTDFPVLIFALTALIQHDKMYFPVYRNTLNLNSLKPLVFSFLIMVEAAIEIE